uniref:Uncharacterized protein n=1 Tax=Alexandrium catenella TaxID=2925 RepID=A0A7S1WX91_ALECA
MAMIRPVQPVGQMRAPFQTGRLTAGGKGFGVQQQVIKTIQKPVTQALMVQPQKQMMAGGGLTVRPPMKQQPKAAPPNRMAKGMAKGGMQAPQLAAMAQEFAHAAADLGTSDENLENMFQQIAASRNPGGFAAMWFNWQAGGSQPAAAAAFPALGNGNAGGEVHLSDAEIAKRKETLLRTVSQRLQKSGGEEPLTNVTGDPTVASLRKGAVGNVAKFLREFPQYFSFGLTANPVEGKGQIQMIGLLQPVPVGALAGMQRAKEAMPEADRREALIESLAVALSDVGGSATVSELGLDSRVQGAAVNVNVKLGKFIAQYPEVFTLQADPSGHFVQANLLVSPAAAVSLANVRAKLGQVDV